MKNKNLFNRKDLKSYRSSLRNRSTSAQPPWPLPAFAILLLPLFCGHPSFKRRGKLYELTEFQHSNPFAFTDPPCKNYFGLLRLTVMGLVDEVKLRECI
jgi:hypothetical protein